MTTYLELRAQAADLLKQADALFMEERAKAILAVQGIVEKFELSHSDLGMKESRIPRVKKEKSGKKTSAVKYQTPDGRSWSGHGRRPEWLKTAIANGGQLSDYLCKE